MLIAAGLDCLASASIQEIDSMPLSPPASLCQGTSTTHTLTWPPFCWTHSNVRKAREIPKKKRILSHAQIRVTLLDRIG